MPIKKYKRFISLNGQENGPEKKIKKRRIFETEVTTNMLPSLISFFLFSSEYFLVLRCDDFPAKIYI